MPVHPSTSADRTVWDATVRLRAEFAERVALARVDAVVAGARTDLDSVPAAALPELLERLARQRLIDPKGERGTAGAAVVHADMRIPATVDAGLWQGRRGPR